MDEPHHHHHHHHHPSQRFNKAAIEGPACQEESWTTDDQDELSVRLVLVLPSLIIFFNTLL